MEENEFDTYRPFRRKSYKIKILILLSIWVLLLILIIWSIFLGIIYHKIQQDVSAVSNVYNQEIKPVIQDLKKTTGIIYLKIDFFISSGKPKCLVT
jgi:uncharacterized membrane protein YvbJ